MKTRRFYPLFITQFLGAFNDNFFKTALVVLIAYGLVDTGNMPPEMLVTIAAGVFIFPFILLSPLGGNIADKYDKSDVIRGVKLAEIIIVIAAIAGFAAGSVWFLMGVLFLFGAQSALFSPSKFAILPTHLSQEELIGGNALVNTGTYLAILTGNILGTILIVTALGQMITMGLLLVCAIIGYISARFIPAAKPSDPDLKINWNTPLEAVRILKYCYHRPHGVFTALISSAWFFFVGGLYLSQLPNYTSQILRVDNFVLTFFLAVFSLGIAFGGLMNNTLLKSKVEATFVPAAALGISFFSLDLFLASRGFGAGVILSENLLMPLSEFMSNVSGWRITFDLLGVSVCGGLYAVPLKSIMQDRTPDAHVARTLAGSSMLDSLFVLISALAAMALFAAGYQIYHLFLMVGVLGIPAALYTTKLVPGLFLGKYSA